MDACPGLPLGVCFDTAHAFTAGYDIREEDGLEALIQKIEATVKTKNVRAIHFNDSRAVYNSRVDRHWHIGKDTSAPRRYVASRNIRNLLMRHSSSRRPMTTHALTSRT